LSLRVRPIEPNPPQLYVYCWSAGKRKKTGRKNRVKNRCAYKLLEEKEEVGLYIFKPPVQGHFQIAADMISLNRFELSAIVYKT